MRDTDKWLRRLRRRDERNTLRGGGGGSGKELLRLSTVQDSLSKAIDRTMGRLLPGRAAESEAATPPRGPRDNQRQWQMRLSNHVSHWVSMELLNCESHQERERMLQLWIKVANVCRELRNYMTLFEIMTGLSHNSVYRLGELFNALPRGLVTVYESLCEITHYGGNYRNYRATVREAMEKGVPLIPYVGVMLRDLVAIEETGSFTYLKKGPDGAPGAKLVNVTKLRQITRIVLDTLVAQHSNYDSIQLDAAVQMRLLAGIAQAADEDELNARSFQIKPRGSKAPAAASSSSSSSAHAL
jgi:hypothetical protein